MKGNNVYCNPILLQVFSSKQVQNGRNRKVTELTIIRGESSDELRLLLPLLSSEPPQRSHRTTGSSLE